MNTKTLRLRLIALATLLVLIAGTHYALNHNPSFLFWYTNQAFPWLQQIRSDLLNRFSLSIGDYIYLILGLFLLLLLIRLIYFSIRYKSSKEDFWTELLRFFTFPSFIYLLFTLLWGGNYARPALAQNLGLEGIDWDEQKLVQINEKLVERLNEIRNADLSFPDFKVLNHQANTYYHQQLNVPQGTLKVKHTSLGYMLNYLGINGYYNPISGEAQFNRFIPKFMHPFVIAHEMAHQTGVAAEDDANLLAYIICAESQDPAFRYSGYFNLFLYAFNDLKSIDTQSANQVLESLNPFSQNDLEELKVMRLKYKSRFRSVSLYLYDEYLRWHGQKEGIKTYAGVVKWAYYWEKTRQQAAGPATITSIARD